METNTNPFRHREYITAQELIDCDMDSCISIEDSVKKSLERKER